MVYIELFHGRTDRQAEMNEWGTPGPIFGPFQFVHTTYTSYIHLGDGEVVTDLRIAGDMVYYDGVYYGDWSIFDEGVFNKYPEADRKLRHVKFESEKAEYKET